MKSATIRKYPANPIFRMISSSNSRRVRYSSAASPGTSPCCGEGLEPLARPFLASSTSISSRFSSTGRYPTSRRPGTCTCRTPSRTAAAGDLRRIFQGLGVSAEELLHLPHALEEELVGRELEPLGVCQPFSLSGCTGGRHGFRHPPCSGSDSRLCPRAGSRASVPAPSVVRSPAPARRSPLAWTSR